MQFPLLCQLARRHPCIFQGLMYFPDLAGILGSKLLISRNIGPHGAQTTTCCKDLSPHVTRTGIKKPPSFARIWPSWNQSCWIFWGFWSTEAKPPGLRSMATRPGRTCALIFYFNSGLQKNLRNVLIRNRARKIDLRSVIVYLFSISWPKPKV